MDLDFGGEMEQVLENERGIDHEDVEGRGTTADIDASHIEMLEMEVEELTADLEQERLRLKEHETVCQKHIRDLEVAEMELLCCRESVNQLESNLERLVQDAKSKDEILRGRKDDLFACRERLEEVERENAELTRSRDREVSSMEVQSQELELIRFELAERTCELVQCRDRYMLLENQYNNQKATILDHQSQLEREMEGSIIDPKDSLRQLKRKVRSLEEEVRGSREAEDRTNKELDTLRNYCKKIEERKSHSERQARDSDKQVEAKSSMIKSLSKQIDELQIKARKVPALTAQLAKIESGGSGVRSDRAVWESERDSMREHIARSDRERKSLQDDKKRLREEVKNLRVELKRVRAPGAVSGLVVCVDISTSMDGPPEQRAKQAFKRLIRILRSKQPNTHVGIVVHTGSVSVLRDMDELDLSVDSILDPISSEGAENYQAAFTLVVSMLTTFTIRHPSATRKVILISDGEHDGSHGDISLLKSEGIICHNVIVENAYGRYETSLSKTTMYTIETGGQIVKYEEETGVRQLEVLLV